MCMCTARSVEGVHKTRSIYPALRCRTTELQLLHHSPTARLTSRNVSNIHNMAETCKDAHCSTHRIAGGLYRTLCRVSAATPPKSCILSCTPFEAAAPVQSSFHPNPLVRSVRSSACPSLSTRQSSSFGGAADAAEVAPLARLLLALPFLSRFAIVSPSRFTAQQQHAVNQRVRDVLFRRMMP